MRDDDDAVARDLERMRVVDARGRVDALARVASKELVVVWFTRDDCAACRAFAPRVVALARRRAATCDVVAVACDDARATTAADDDGAGDDGVWRAVVATAADARAVNAILRALAVATLPAVVVVRRDARAVVTTWGRAALVARGDDVVDAWRRGESGLNPFGALARCVARALSACAPA